MAEPERKTDRAVIVIMVSPSHVPFGGTKDKKHLSGHSMVTWHGRKLLYVKADFTVYRMGKYYYDRQEKRKVTGMWKAGYAQLLCLLCPGGPAGDMRVIMEKETVMCRGAILPSGMVHTVESSGEPFLVFLFDITSTVSEQMPRFTVLEEQTAEGIALSYQTLTAGAP